MNFWSNFTTFHKQNLQNSQGSYYKLPGTSKGSQKYSENSWDKVVKILWLENLKNVEILELATTVRFPNHSKTTHGVDCPPTQYALESTFHHCPWLTPQNCDTALDLCSCP